MGRVANELDGALCATVERRGWRVWCQPDAATAAELEQARQTCQACPVLKACALQAITGSSVTHLQPADAPFSAVAQGVFQAGVHCVATTFDRRKRATRAALCQAAGVPYIPSKQQATAMKYGGQPCVSCGRLMVPGSRRRGPVPSGKTRHYAQGYCEKCRRAYRAALDSGRLQRVAPVNVLDVANQPAG